MTETENNSRLQTIALDGPAASGKSTVAYLLARRLGFLYFDTGAMYRAITLMAIMGGYDLTDGVALGALARETPIEVEPPTVADGRQYTVRVGTEDITWGIRAQKVEQYVSAVSAHPSVRAALNDQQRRIGLQGNVIMVGRDIGTVVLPEAPLKIFLDASVEERAKRRTRELEARGEQPEYDKILADMRARDAQDRNRVTAPLRPADDAVVINSDGMSADEVVRAIEELARTRFKL